MLIRLAVSLLLILTPLAHPQVPSSHPVVTEVSHSQMRLILQGMGFEFTEQASSNGSYLFLFQLNGYKVSLMNQVTDMQLYAGFSDKVDISRVNEWNRTYRFGRAYVNDKGGPSLENDLSFSGGVTTETIAAFIKQFRTTLTGYVQFVTDVPSGSSATPSNTAAVSSAPVAVSAKPAAEAPSFRKSASAKKLFKTSIPDFALWVDEAKWKPDKTDKPGELVFKNVNGEAWAKVITERLPLSTGNLREIVLANAQSADPNAKIIFEEKRTVNGREILALQLVGTIKGIPFKYFGYYHGGSSGMIQAIGYTVESEFGNNVEAFTEFLNGLDIRDQDLPEATTQAGAKAGVLSFNSGMSVRYDASKWKQTPSNEAGRFTFTHSSGDGYGMIIAERIPVSIDSLPDIALSNAQEADPNARISFKEKRQVNGVSVWFLKIDAVVKGIPIVYCGYYYGGQGGTVQVLTYTGKTLLAEYEKDFIEFMNGFSVAQ